MQVLLMRTNYFQSRLRIKGLLSEVLFSLGLPRERHFPSEAQVHPNKWNGTDIFTQKNPKIETPHGI